MGEGEGEGRGGVGGSSDVEVFFFWGRPAFVFFACVRPIFTYFLRFWKESNEATLQPPLSTMWENP